ncbi:hypothetical protein KQI30_08295 [Clostridium bornimense]|uniref:hypothetical protein n=1 Tax=Clostridium bornimense TaxID=1216932 RepID=UPI001C10B04B|nr:hypothetical protein [Clostridium bornimense]MBU5316269.1 hypothetical protein [Clostridium bornimense]
MYNEEKCFFSYETIENKYIEKFKLNDLYQIHSKDKVKLDKWCINYKENEAMLYKGWLPNIILRSNEGIVR